MTTFEDAFQDNILVIDFGSQFSRNIVKRLRNDCNVKADLVPYNIPFEEIIKLDPNGIFLSGGPDSVTGEEHLDCDRRIFELDVPMFCICYGLQLTAKHYGGKVVKAEKREYGPATLNLTDYGIKDISLKGMDRRLDVWMSHGDSVMEIPGFYVLGSSENSPFAAVKHKDKPIYGVQFHPEVHHTPQGAEMFRNFAVDICGCKPNWTMDNIVETSVQEIRDKVGDSQVIGGISGGVDSAVAATLTHMAVGDKAVFVVVDNGLLRKDEAKEIMESFKGMDMNINIVYAEREFLSALEDVDDPEKKRSIIGNTFIKVFNREAKKRGVDLDGEVYGGKVIRKPNGYLMQGTLWPDIIESMMGIKTHHNRSEDAKKLDERGRLIEPLRYLFKDDARAIGRKIGVPESIVGRWPFPGPGNAIRIKGEVTQERLYIVQEADYIVQEEIKKAELYNEIWQGLCVLLPGVSVGVMGDERTYESAIVVRLVTSVDAMTAKGYRLPEELEDTISNRIVNEVRGVNRVTYDRMSKPPATIEWE